MENIGDKVILFKNTEDIMSAYTLEILDICEVAPMEFYYEIIERDFFIPNKLVIFN